MSRYLIKTTDVYRVDTLAEVEQFHSELKNDANFELDSFGYKQKQVKQKGEIVDEYCLVIQERTVIYHSLQTLGLNIRQLSKLEC